MTVSSGLVTRIRESAVRRGGFVLASGEVLDEYFDQYALAAAPDLLAEVAEAMAGLIPADVDVVAGVALGGVPLAVAVSAVTGIPAAFVRPEPKPYGLRRQVEGDIASGSRVVVVDDVVRTGGQVYDAIRALHGVGARVPRAVCVLDRRLGGSELLRENGIELRGLLDPDMLEYLPQLEGVSDAVG
ncbi:orotate phosphoribosyltransferase [Nocardia fusca]|uniref:orotate phosphoribosyltransferase n=1 Tax=Nocardia fusca TaxID=941183 RepID=UPI0007A76593|nr:orotate phosphoribosyltransferase [Nocardia fusca]